ncbi:MAG: hypothetical protein ABEH58_01360 [Haloplanus sp.]
MPNDTGKAELPASLNRLAVVVFVVAGLVAMATLFAFPVIRSIGLSANQTFIVVGVVEFVSALVAGTAAVYFYTGRDDGGGVG